jgi:hypothetical protein
VSQGDLLANFALNAGCENAWFGWPCDPEHGLRISGSQSHCWYSTVKVFELIDVLSECGPGFGVGWVLGTISATGCHGSIETRRHQEAPHVGRFIRRASGGQCALRRSDPAIALWRKAPTIEYRSSIARANHSAADSSSPHARWKRAQPIETP